MTTIIIYAIKHVKKKSDKDYTNYKKIKHKLSLFLESFLFKKSIKFIFQFSYIFC